MVSTQTWGWGEYIICPGCHCCHRGHKVLRNPKFKKAEQVARGTPSSLKILKIFPVTSCCFWKDRKIYLTEQRQKNKKSQQPPPSDIILAHGLWSQYLITKIDFTQIFWNIQVLRYETLLYSLLLYVRFHAREKKTDHLWLFSSIGFLGRS